MSKDITGGVSSESQAGAVSAAEGCDHAIGGYWDGYGLDLKYVSEAKADPRLDLKFNFCPNCGAKLNHDALFPPDTRP